MLERQVSVIRLSFVRVSEFCADKVATLDTPDFEIMLPGLYDVSLAAILA